MTSVPELGEIVTFYSYKGGTGRSMALANIACLLAQRQMQKRGKGVLVVDWDLEAPGLHRFLRERLRRRFGSSSDYDMAINEYPGLIDLLCEMRTALAKLTVPREEPDEQTEVTLINTVPLENYLLETDIEGLHFLKAGKFEDEYARRVNTFDWDALHKRAPWLFSWFVNRLAQRYAYVLIDSRTGITDTSGICTMILPEKLVVVFTPNRQSTEGALGLIRQSVAYRGRSDDLRPLRVYPLPSRIEGTMEDLRSFWRSDQTVGYQPQFESLFQEIYKLPHCDLAPYFDSIFIQQAPDYAFGEEIAVLRGKSQDRLSISGSYAQFTDWLAGATFPWETREQVQAQSLAETLVRSAIAALARFSPDEQVIAKRVLTRLVALGEVGQGTRLTLKIAEFQPAEVSIVHALVEARVLQLQQHGKEDVVELAHDALIPQWPHLRQWLDEDREFLLWRQALDIQRASWDRKGRSVDLLLRGTALAEARQWTQKRPADLNPAESEYILESHQAEWKATAAEEERLKREREERLQAERAKQAAEEERLKREQEGRAREAAEQERLTGEQAEGAGRRLWRLRLGGLATVLILGSLMDVLYLRHVHDLHHRQADQKQAEGQMSAAILEWNEVLRYDPNNQHALTRRGQAFLALHRPSDAVESFLKVNPRSPEVLSDLAYAYKEQEEYGKAIDIYRMLLTDNPKDVQAYRDRGFAFQVTGKYEFALYDYISALKIAPDAPTAWACVAMRQAMLQEQRKPQLGDVELASLLERAGFESLIAGDYENARRGFQSCENRYPRYHNVFDILGLIQSHKSDLADPAKKKQIFQLIVSKYSWGLPPDLLERLKAAAQE